MNISRGVVPLVAAVLAIIGMYLSFVAGVTAALDGSGDGSLLWQVVFIVAGLVVVAALVLAVINLVTKRSVVLGIITIAVCLVPAVIIAIVLVGLAG